jgi:hypothetical protein
MVAQGPYPSNAQLSERNAFTIRYCRQGVRGLERRFGGVSASCDRHWRVQRGTYIILGTAGMISGQSTTERPVGVE